jgi:hypothetical protein
VTNIQSDFFPKSILIAVRIVDLRREREEEEGSAGVEMKHLDDNHQWHHGQYIHPHFSEHINATHPLPLA